MITLTEQRGEQEDAGAKDIALCSAWEVEYGDYTYYDVSESMQCDTRERVSVAE